jgi:hypothetical protein
MYERETERLQKMIEESESIVFFGGAGVSTESGTTIFTLIFIVLKRLSLMFVK